MARASRQLQQIEARLRDCALRYPEAHEEFPWGERALKVKKKIFAILRTDTEHLYFTVKLPESHRLALIHPFAKPTGYGLGKSGWITATFSVAEDVPLDLLEAWLEESYRAIAPKKLIAVLDGEPPSPKKKSKKS